MDDFPMPRYLVESLERDADDRRQAWMAALPATVRQLAERWSLEVGEPFQPGGSTFDVAYYDYKILLLFWLLAGMAASLPRLLAERGG